MKAVLLAACLALALPFAGCLGGDVDTDDAGDGNGTRTTSTSGTRTSANVTVSGSAGNASGNASAGGSVGGNGTGNATGNTTGNATGNMTGNATGNSTWTYDNRTGSVSGTGVPLVSSSFDEEETFTIANGTQKLVLNLSVDGDDVVLNVQEPGCDGTDCGTEVETDDDGKATIAFNSPAEGEWTATLTISGTGPISTDYTLSIQTLGGNATASP